MELFRDAKTRCVSVRGGDGRLRIKLDSRVSLYCIRGKIYVLTTEHTRAVETVPDGSNAIQHMRATAKKWVCFGLQPLKIR